MAGVAWEVWLKPFAWDHRGRGRPVAGRSGAPPVTGGVPTGPKPSRRNRQMNANSWS